MGAPYGTLQYDLGPLRLNAWDDDGTLWVCGPIDGWNGAAPFQASLDNLPDADGGKAGPAYFTPRPLSAAGTFQVDDPVKFDGAEILLVGVLAAMARADGLLVVYSTIPRQATVRLAGPPLVTPQTDRVASFSLSLVAPDPRKYGTTLKTVRKGVAATTTKTRKYPRTYPLTYTDDLAAADTQIAHLANAGNWPSPPLITVHGPLPPGWSMELSRDDTGEVRTVVVDATLAATDQAVVDVLNGRITLNGTASLGTAVRTGSRWWSVPNGTTATARLLSPTASPSAWWQIDYRDAYA